MPQTCQAGLWHPLENTSEPLLYKGSKSPIYLNWGRTLFRSIREVYLRPPAGINKASNTIPQYWDGI